MRYPGVTFGGWCLTPLATIFQILQLYCGGQFNRSADETGISEENHRPVVRHWHTLSHNVVWCTPRHERYSNSQCVWWQAQITQGGLNPTTIRARPRRSRRHPGKSSIYYSWYVIVELDINFGKTNQHVIIIAWRYQRGNQKQ
jgi:hypothetical protein